MNRRFYTDRLQANIKIFEGLLDGISKEESKWKPANDKWSILEVINHLYDEEIFDFRARLESVIQNSQKMWTPINPQVWVNEREYNKRELSESFNKFRQERMKSLEWLGALKNINWENAYNHSQGKIRAGDLLTSWAAHDLIHVRQLTVLQWQILNLKSKPYSSAYAGDW